MADWRFAPTTAKLKSAYISYTHIYVWRYRTEPPNLNPQIFLLKLIIDDLPNLIPAKFPVLHDCNTIVEVLLGENVPH